MSKSEESLAKNIAIIPARFGSTRFPGKLLAKIAGKSLIQRTYENACHCTKIDRIIIATDDKRIFDHVSEFGAEAVMTPIDCLTGTDRLIEVIKQGHCEGAECLVNIQGDQPLIEPETIHKIIDALYSDPEASMSTGVVPLETSEEAHNPGVVKCVINKKNRALYFSRALIPFGHAGYVQAGVSYYHHLGTYAYRPKFLLELAKLPPTPLQLAEDLEQLKVLEYGYHIAVALVTSNSFGVDYLEDVKKVEDYLCKQNTFLSQAAFAPHLEKD